MKITKLAVAAIGLATAAPAVANKAEPVRVLKSSKSGKGCGPKDYEGIWTYTSQGGGNSYNTMITCPSILNGDCQIMDQSVNIADCGVIGTIKKSKMSKNSNGKCVFAPTALTERTSIGGCATIVEGERDGDYMLLLFGDGTQDLDNPVYYNAGSPRHGLGLHH